MTSIADHPVSPALERVLQGLLGTKGGRDVRVRWSDGASADAPHDPLEPWDEAIEQLLVESAAGGDEEALEMLCRNEWFGVYRLISAEVTEQSEVEDLAQEVFARAISNLPRFRYVGIPFQTYLGQIARNLLRDRARRLHGKSDRHLAVVSEVSESEPEAITLAAEQRDELVDAIRRLPDQFREVLRLRILEGRTAAEVGIEWGRSTDWVRQIQYDALLALRAELQGAEDEEVVPW